MREIEQFLFKPGKRQAKGRRSSYLGRGQSSEQSSLPTDSETYSWSWRSANPTKQFYGERRLLLNLVNESNNGFTMIGIVGLAGVGKTTLCQETFNNQDVKKHFLPRIWVCMAKQPNETDHEKEVVKRILMGLGFEDKIIEKIYKEGGGLCRLLFALRQELKGKKYLIVLDDVSSLNEGFVEFCSLINTQDVGTSDSDRLADGLPTGDGGTVIVSSRCKEMAKKMVGEKNLHCLLPLADKGRSWNIFKDEVAKDGLTPPQFMEEPRPQDKEKMENMEKMKDMIADRCGGLPFFAKMLGQCVHQNLQTKQKEKHETQKKESPETRQKEKKETPEKQSPKTQQKEKQETLQKESQQTQKKEKHETQQKGSQETQHKEKQETPQENKHEIQQKASQETQQEQKHETQQKGSQEAQQKEKQETSQENKHEIQQKESQETQQKASQETQQEQKHETQQKESQETQQKEKHETQQKESQETQQKEKQETPQENKHEIQQKESQETQQKESPGTQHKESKETQQKEKHETQQKESGETLKEEEIEKHET